MVKLDTTGKITYKDRDFKWIDQKLHTIKKEELGAERIKSLLVNREGQRDWKLYTHMTILNPKHKEHEDGVGDATPIEGIFDTGSPFTIVPEECISSKLEFKGWKVAYGVSYEREHAPELFPLYEGVIKIKDFKTKPLLIGGSERREAIIGMDVISDCLVYLEGYFRHKEGIMRSVNDKNFLDNFKSKLLKFVFKRL